MLVLTRKPGETIHIGGGIVVKVIENRGNDGVRIGIEAPRGVLIHRGEILEAVAAENREAAVSAAEGESLAALLSGPKG